MIVDLETFTAIHTIISLIAIVAGPFVVIGLLKGQVDWFWTTLFLLTAIVTSVTGFGFPFTGVLLPSHITGIIALVVLALVLAARYVGHLAGAWRWIYAVGMVISLYLLVFVGIVQAFLKIPSIRALAPTQTETPFLAVQVATLVIFIILGIASARSFRPALGLRAL
jgi:hypothetical protein